MSYGAFLAADAFSLGITVTNWMSGIAATIARLPVQKATSLLLSSLVIVGVLFGGQKALFPSSNMPVFLKPFNAKAEVVAFSGNPYSGGRGAALRGILFHGMVAPAIRFHPSGGRMLTFQMSGLGSSGKLGLVATALWATLMTAGVVSLFACRMATATRLAFGAVLLGQLALHTIYGDEAFLYDLHVTPLLVILAALTTLTRANRGPGPRARTDPVRTREQRPAVADRDRPGDLEATGDTAPHPAHADPGGRAAPGTRICAGDVSRRSADRPGVAEEPEVVADPAVARGDGGGRGRRLALAAAGAGANEARRKRPGPPRRKAAAGI